MLLPNEYVLSFLLLLIAAKKINALFIYIANSKEKSLEILYSIILPDLAIPSMTSFQRYALQISLCGQQ